MSDRPELVDLHIAGVGAAEVLRSDRLSIVHRASHETRGHDVEVEIFPGSRGEAARARFALQYQALGRLAEIDGVVPLLEAGVTIDGDLYLMTPTLGGRTLAEIIATDGPMPWAEATRIIEAAATTVHHAHLEGIVHRRIGPDAVVVTDDDRVLVTGLGGAGLMLDAAGTPPVTEDRLGYCAPEWSATAGAASADEGATPASDTGAAGDIFGLGATLWALLTGHPPSAATAPAAAAAQVADLRAAAPASLAQVVEWATAFDPERRPSSAATFARALREAAARAPSDFVARPGDTAARRSTAHADPAPADPADDPTVDLDDGRRAGLLVAVAIAAIALVALGASALLMAIAGDDPSVTITGPQIEPAEQEAPAEVLGVDVEADDGDRSPAGPGTAASGDERDDPNGTGPTADGTGGSSGGSAGPAGQSATIAPFAIPTPTAAPTEPTPAAAP